MFFFCCFFLLIFLKELKGSFFKKAKTTSLPLRPVLGTEGLPMADLGSNGFKNQKEKGVFSTFLWMGDDSRMPFFPPVLQFGGFFQLQHGFCTLVPCFYLAFILFITIHHHCTTKMGFFFVRGPCHLVISRRVICGFWNHCHQVILPALSRDFYKNVVHEITLHRLRPHSF